MALAGVMVVATADAAAGAPPPCAAKPGHGDVRVRARPDGAWAGKNLYVENTELDLSPLTAHVDLADGQVAKFELRLKNDRGKPRDMLLLAAPPSGTASTSYTFKRGGADVTGRMFAGKVFRGVKPGKSTPKITLRIAMESESGYLVGAVDGQRNGLLPACESSGDRIPDRVFVQINELPG
jgi:hypothetical protein